MMNKMKRFLNQPIDTPLKRFVSLFVAMAMVLSVLTVTSLSTTTPASAAGGETSYKVTNDSKGSIDLTIKHKNNGVDFYTADQQTLKPGDFIDNYNKVKNYNVTSVTLDNKTVSNPQDLRLITAGSHTIVVNYQASTSNVINPVKFYDYTLHPDNDTNSFKNGINDSANYSSTSSVKQRFAIGNNNIQRKNNTNKSGFYDTNGNFVYMNYYTGRKAGIDDRLGIITNLSGANYSQVNFNNAISAPKLFNNDPKVKVLGLTNIDNYKLNFSRTGDTYTLTKVLNENGENANESYTGSSNFFPLNHVSSVRNNNEDKEAGKRNVYFGMRYDFTFTLGDYNGPLNYTFNGDDDLWVFLDGQLVLDDGGIHGAIEKTVNIKEILGPNPDKSAVHQITVLYMERGGNESNCAMNFTIPNLTPINYQEAQKIDVEFRKQNAHQEALAGAKFSVVDDNKVSLGEFTSDANGKVTLKDLREGTYYVTETKAPDRYVLTGNVQYKIVVSRTNGKLTYKLYQPGENNTWSEMSNKTIINKSEQEVEQDSIVANKKAELVTYTDGGDAWNDRLYDITLNPVSNKKITTTTTTTTPGQDEAIASQTTTEVTEKIVNITDATVVDTIDKRFKLTDETRAALQGQATVTDNEDGTTTVKWEHQTIMADGSTKYVLRVKAKDSYFGGNNVATNVKDKSYIETPSGAQKEFDQPHVNVKAELTAKDYKTTRFAGETFDATHVESKNNKSLGQILSPQYDKSEVTKVWKDANGNTTTLDKMNAITTDAQYRLELSYNAGEATSESTEATKGHSNPKDMTATGHFEINFKKGSLKITKKIDKQYTTGKTQLVELADNDSGLAVGLKQDERDTNDYTQSNQTFIYKIQRKVDNVVKETFYATISFDSKDTTKEKSVIIHNLEKGDYTVTEETNWSRKYSLNDASTNNGTTLYSFGSKSTTDGNNLKIGYREDTTKNYFTGLDEDANDNAGYIDTNDGYADATFTKAVMTRSNNYVTDQDVKAIYTNNKKNNWYWNSDAAIAINKYN